MFSYTSNEFKFLFCDDSLPEIYSEYRENAVLVDEIDIRNSEGSVMFFAAQKRASWPELVVAQRYNPGQPCFHPDLAFIPETNIALLGAGERILIYDLSTFKKVGTENVYTGFWGWERHKDYILMAAELEFAVWDLYGKKIWTTIVEPPWDYQKENSAILLDVMGEMSKFELISGKRIS